MRKKPNSLQEARNDIKKKYKRGPKRDKRVQSESSMTDVEKVIAQEKAALLKASDFSHKYIAEACGVTSSIVKKWFQEPVMQERVAKYHSDIVAGGIKLLRTYAIEFLEMLAEIARTTNDERLAFDVIKDGLDRMGISKVNKSESVTAKTERHETDITDKTGILELFRDAPPEVQKAAAEKMDDILSLASERTQ